MSGEADIFQKHAGVTPEVSASPIPSPVITPTPAPGLRGPNGLSPRANFSRVNTGAPPAAEAGADVQKSAPPMGAAMLPKVASSLTSEVAAMGTSMAPRLTLQDMVKAAMAEGVQRASLTAEAARQLGLTEKSASTAAALGTEDEVSTEEALKLASAIEHGLGMLKQGSIHLPTPVGGGTAAPGKGPGALPVSESRTGGGTPVPDPGKAHNQGPSSGLQSTHGDAKTQIKNDIDRPSPQKMGAAPYDLLRKLSASDASKEKKESEGLAAAQAGLDRAERAHASEHKEEKKEGSGDPFLDYVLTRPKTAEDAINPARISAGVAVPPNTSASGEAGGAPAGGQPQGPRHLIASNDAARGYTRADAYANRKKDLTTFLTEPALAAATDKTLEQAWAHTSEAGPKIAAATDLQKVAAGRALLAKLTQITTQTQKAGA